jgi:hypothetical protein
LYEFFRYLPAIGVAGSAQTRLQASTSFFKLTTLRIGVAAQYQPYRASQLNEAYIL